MVPKNIFLSIALLFASLCNVTQATVSKISITGLQEMVVGQLQNPTKTIIPGTIAAIILCPKLIEVAGKNVKKITSPYFVEHALFFSMPLVIGFIATKQELSDDKKIDLLKEACLTYGGALFWLKIIQGCHKITQMLTEKIKEEKAAPKVIEKQEEVNA